MKKLYLTNEDLKRNAREAYAAGLLGFQDRGACCTGMCQYRYGNAKGSRCAIGASIPDELMPHVVEGDGPRSASFQRLIDWEDAYFAARLQSLHDDIVGGLFEAYNALSKASHQEWLDEANAALAEFLAEIEWQGEAPKPLTIAWRGVD